LRRGPGFNAAAAHMLSGEALDGLQRTQEAIAEFQAAAKVSPQEPNVHFGIGYLYWKSRQYDDAKREFENQLLVDPKQALALAYLGDIAMKETKPDEALSLLRKAAGMKNDIRIAYIDLGAVLSEKGQYEDAIAALRRAVELDPSQPDAHYRLARAYRAMGKVAESQKEFAKVRQLHDESDDSLASRMAAAPPPLPQ